MLSTDELKVKANSARKNIIEEVYRASSGHPGGSLSCIDILTAIYFNHANIDVNDIKKVDRDRIILSKGHASPALYSILAEKGFFDKEILKTFRQSNSMLQGHPEMKNIPGVDMTTGSLGQGLSAGNGMALANRLDGLNNNIYVIIGDGELQEGQIWEAIMTTAHYGLNKVIAIIDHNGLQIDGTNKEIKGVDNVVDKFKAFNWNTLEIDGHNFDEINHAIAIAKKSENRPTAIIANTVKGKGISFMENQVKWHGAAPSEGEYTIAMNELNGEVM